MKTMTLHLFLREDPGQYLNNFNKDIDNFYKSIEDANKLIDDLNKQNEHNAQIIQNMQNIMKQPDAVNNFQNSINTQQVQTPTPSDKSWFQQFLNKGHVGKEGVTGNGETGVVNDGMNAIADSIKSIGDFCKGLNWIASHPWETFGIILHGLCNVVQILSLLVCAGSILMAILGHKGGIKYIPISMVIYFLLKVLVVIL